MYSVVPIYPIEVREKPATSCRWSFTISLVKAQFARPFSPGRWPGGAGPAAGGGNLVGARDQVRLKVMLHRDEPGGFSPKSALLHSAKLFIALCCSILWCSSLA